MAGQLLSTAQTIFAILVAFIAITTAFYKVITDKTKLEAELRNEIENLEEKQKAMNLEFEKLMNKFDLITDQLRAATAQVNRIPGMEKMFERIETKMDNFGTNLNSMKDNFNEKLNQININMERKQDKKAI